METILDELISEVEFDTQIVNEPYNPKPREIEYDGAARPGIEDDEFEVVGKDTRRRIRRTTTAPFRYICHVEINRGTGGEPGRTGTLIGPKTVLTAAHCIWNETNDRLEDLSTVVIRVIPGRNGTSEPLPATQAKKLIVPSGYNRSKGASSLDYGIIQLKDDIGSKIGYWSMDYKKWPKDSRGVSILQRALPLRAGVLKVNLSGYPTDRGGGIRQYWSYNRTHLLRDGMLHYLNDTGKGHSGSPVWVKRHSSMGGRVLVGVHVAGDDGTGKKANRAVFIDDTVRRFITANTF